MSGSVEWDSFCTLPDVALPDESGVANGDDFCVDEALVLGLADLMDDVE